MLFGGISGVFFLYAFVHFWRVESNIGGGKQYIAPQVNYWGAGPPGPPASYTTGPVNHLRFYPGGGGSEPQMDTGAPLQLCEGHAMGVGAKKKKQLKNPTHMGAYFLKSDP